MSLDLWSVATNLVATTHTLNAYTFSTDVADVLDAADAVDVLDVLDMAVVVDVADTVDMADILDSADVVKGPGSLIVLQSHSIEEYQFFLTKWV